MNLGHPPPPLSSLSSPERQEALVRGHTVIARPPLCPELRLHLVTDACPLWRAGEAELARLGLGEPFWAFAWPGGQAIARHLLDHPELCRGRRVLSFGAGGGVEAIAAARAGAASVRATDIDPLAVVACRLNARLNDVVLEADAADLLGVDALDFDLVLAGDVTYEVELGVQVIAWLSKLAGQGAQCLVADPGRGFLPNADLEPIALYDAPSDVDVDGRYRVTTTVSRVRPASSL